MHPTACTFGARTSWLSDMSDDDPKPVTPPINVNVRKSKTRGVSPLKKLPPSKRSGAKLLEGEIVPESEVPEDVALPDKQPSIDRPWKPYQPEFSRQARMMCKLGATDMD